MHRQHLVACLLVAAFAVACSSGGSSKGPDSAGETPDQSGGTDTVGSAVDVPTAVDVPVDVAPEVTAEPLPFAPAGPGEAPDPMSFGPFPVGVRTYDLYDDSRPDPERGTGRWLRTDVWYPAVQAARDGERAVIDLKVEALGIDLGDKEDVIMNADIPEIPTEAVRDALLDASHGPYPVVLFSHGSNGIRWQSVFYTVHLASHGYIVISPDHDYNTLWDILIDGFMADTMADSLTKRPDDMRFLLDTLLGWHEDADSPFFGAVDGEHVAASGHSLGGVTSTALGCLDERIDVIVLHSPQIMAGQMIGGCMDKPYPVPSLTQGGTLDDTLTYCGQYCDYRHELFGDQPRYLMELVDGGHFTFSDVCLLDLVEVARELEMGSDAEHILTDGCGDFNVDYEIAHDTINYYATAFLNGYLRGSEASLDLLVERDEAPFDVINFFEGDVPDFWGEGGCAECSVF